MQGECLSCACLSQGSQVTYRHSRWLEKVPRLWELVGLEGGASQQGAYKAYVFYDLGAVYGLQWLQGNWISSVLLAK